jgi:hypothetical protein
VTFNKKAIIKENNRDVFQERQLRYRSDNNRFNTRLNQNLISILAIGYGLNQGIYREQDLNNEIMNRLKGNQANYDDSLFNTTQDDRTSRTTVVEKQYTYSQRNHTDMLQQGTHKSNISGP